MLYLFLACQPPSDSATPKTVDEARAEIKVDPPEISFGQVLENDTVAHMETVTVSNIGDSALELYGLALENTNASFCTGLSAGGSRPVHLLYSDL